MKGEDVRDQKGLIERKGKKMFDKGLRQRLISPKHSFLCTFVMQERRKPDSEWNIYINILPQSYTNFPIFFTLEEKKML
jgi:hypothetical protein